MKSRRIILLTVVAIIALISGYLVNYYCMRTRTRSRRLQDIVRLPDNVSRVRIVKTEYVSSKQFSLESSSKEIIDAVIEMIRSACYLRTHPPIGLEPKWLVTVSALSHGNEKIYEYKIDPDMSPGENGSILMYYAEKGVYEQHCFVMPDLTEELLNAYFITLTSGSDTKVIEVDFD